VFKVLTEGCEPIRATKHSAAIDLYASEDVTIPAGKTAMIGLGVCIDLDTPQLAEMKTLGTYNDFLQSHYLALEPRSSLRAKGLVAGTGIIDLDYIPSCTKGLDLSNDICNGFKQKLKV